MPNQTSELVIKNEASGPRRCFAPTPLCLTCLRHACLFRFIGRKLIAVFGRTTPGAIAVLLAFSVKAL